MADLRRVLRNLTATLLLTPLLVQAGAMDSVKARKAAEDKYEEGLGLIEAGNLDGAQAAFEAGLAVQAAAKSVNGKLYSGIAEVQLRKNVLTNAEDAARKAVELSPDKTSYLALSNVLLLKRDTQGAFDNAKLAAESCNVLAQSNTEVAKKCYADSYIALGRIVRVTGNFEKANEFFDQAAGNGARPSVVEAEKAQALNLAGKVSEGQALAEHALKENPGYPPAVIAKSTAQIMNGQVAEARKEIEPILAKDPVQVLEFLQVARSFVDQKKFKEAVELYEMAADLQPNNAYVWMDLAFGYEQVGRLEDSAKAYQKALSTLTDLAMYVGQPDAAAFAKALKDTPTKQDRLGFLAIVYNNYGTVLYRTSKVPEATDALARSQAADPNQLPVTLTLVSLYTDQKKDEQALAMLRHAETLVKAQEADLAAKASTLPPEQAAEQKAALAATKSDVYKRLGITLFNMKKQEEAKPYLMEAARLAPDDPFTALGVGVVFFNEEKWADALPHLEKAYAAMPADGAVQLNLGVTYQKLGQNDKAIPLLEEAKKKDAQNPNIYYALSLAYEATGNKKAATDNATMFRTLEQMKKK